MVYASAKKKWIVIVYLAWDNESGWRRNRQPDWDEISGLDWTD